MYKRQTYSGAAFGYGYKVQKDSFENHGRPADMREVQGKVRDNFSSIGFYAQDIHRKTETSPTLSLPFNADNAGSLAQQENVASSWKSASTPGDYLALAATPVREYTARVAGKGGEYAA